MNLFEYISIWADQKKYEKYMGTVDLTSQSDSCNGRFNDFLTDKILSPLVVEDIFPTCLTKTLETTAEQLLFSNDKSSFEQAFLLLKEACTIGTSINVVAILGFCYEFGLGTQVNYSLAESAYVLAAEKGNIPLAQSRLAFLRKYGRPGLSISLGEAEHWSNTLAAHGPIGALSWLKRASINGLPAALYSLGACYHDGLGCPKNETQAFLLYKQAADQGFVYAYGVLGYCYGEGFGTKKDYEKSISYYFKAVQDLSSASLDTVALFNLGCCYEDGNKGLPQDFKKAAYYYQLAARKGNAYAQSALGYFYEYGIGGLENNKVKASIYYRLSAEQGYPWAQTNLGYCYQEGIGVPKDSSLAFWWYSKAALQGHPRALHNLGHCYQSGLGVSRDEAKAFILFEESAAQGHLFAYHSLGHCYQHGIGVAVDMQKAICWYAKASDANHGPAQLSLAYCYKNGIGCEKNIEKALFWFERAAYNGVALAQNIIGSFSELGIYPNIIPKDPYAAVDWYRRASIQGLSYALCNLGFCYEKGNGIEQSYEKAFKLYEVAALKGHSRAMDKLGLFYLSGKGVPANTELALFWFKRSAESGYALGMVHYGEALEEGCGIEKSTTNALLWYQLAASKGKKEGLDKLRCLLLKLAREKANELILYGHTACAA